MATAGFTFVNTTGMPGLSESAAKQMRSHTTRNNFAKRRQRLQLAKTANGNLNDPFTGTPQQRRVSSTRNPLGDGYRMEFMRNGISRPSNADQAAKSLSEFWSTVFLNGEVYPECEVESTWMELIVSEPSLLQTTLAVGIRHSSPDAAHQELADRYWSCATNRVIQLISSGKAFTDAVLGTISTMAFGERLLGNEAAWNIHIDGLAQVIRHRYLNNGPDLPPWLVELSVLDAANVVLGFPRFSHPEVVNAMRLYGYSPVTDVAAVCDDLLDLRSSISNDQKQHPALSSSVAEALESRVHRLSSLIQALRIHDDLSVHATSFTLELLLHLSWQRHPPLVRVDLTSIAEQLREVLSRIQFRPCSYASLTSCQLMIGAIAADEGSETKRWFIAKLKNALLGVQKHGSVDFRELLGEGFVSDAPFMASFRQLWHEVSQA